MTNDLVYKMMRKFHIIYLSVQITISFGFGDFNMVSLPLPFILGGGATIIVKNVEKPPLSGGI